MPSFVARFRRVFRMCANGCGWLLLGNAALAANELGRPILREFAPGAAKVGFMNLAVTQDREGFVYLASYWVIRCYDGVEWKPLPDLPEETALIRRFALGGDGRVYVGGAGIIGYLDGAGEAARFVSLADRLPPTEIGCDEIHDVVAIGPAVYFADEEKILRWQGGKFSVIPCRAPPHSRATRLHGVDGIAYVTSPGRPLCRIVEERFEPVTDDPVVRDNTIVMIEPGAAGGLTLLTAGHGFYQLADGHVSVLPSEANHWLTGRVIVHATRMHDGSLAVIFDAPSGSGGMRFDAAGRYVGPIDQTLGIYVSTYRDVFCDREGGLWLGMTDGAFRIEWPSAVTVFDAVNGLGAGAVTGVTRHEGVLYAASDEGVFRLHPMDEQGHVARFERMLGQPVSSLVSHASGLLALGYKQLLVQTAGGFDVVAETPPGSGVLLPSKFDPNLVWVATPGGLQAVRHTTQGWKDKGLQLAFGEGVTGVRTEAGGSLWVAQGDHRGFRVTFSATDGRPMKGAVESVDSHAADILAECATVDGARWVARATDVELVPAKGGAPRALPKITTAGLGTVTSLREENGPDGAVLWIGAAEGLARVDVARAFPSPVPYAVLLTATGVEAGDRLAPEHTALRFDYVALRLQQGNEVTYQTRLAGFDDNWSDWTTERTRIFFRLPAGSYRFEVRARDADGIAATPAVLAFSVRPPWWFAWWAITGYVIAGAVAMAGYIRHHTRALHRRAEQLEKVVAERTAELARQNTELVRLNQLELDEIISARLAEEKARLEVLRYQLNPHFLFNTLASISASLPVGRSTARTMVERLAEFCRLTLHRPDERDWTTLGEEVKLLRAYLEIEQSRWGDLLDVEINCAPELTAERLPHFLLLPLLENALKYGRATSSDRVGIRLTAARGEDRALVLVVANTGTWVEPDERKTVASLGIGLENLRERLARHYPRAHRLDITPAGGWVTVTLHIRARPAE